MKLNIAGTADNWLEALGLTEDRAEYLHHLIHKALLNNPTNKGKIQLIKEIVEAEVDEGNHGELMYVALQLPECLEGIRKAVNLFEGSPEDNSADAIADILNQMGREQGIELGAIRIVRKKRVQHPSSLGELIASMLGQSGIRGES